MKKPFLTWITLLLIIFSEPCYAQATAPEPPLRRCFVGTSGFLLFNLLPNPPSFY